MKYIRGFLAFWYDFIVGDAWEVAAGVVLALLLLFAFIHYLGSNNSSTGAFELGGLGALLLPLIIVALLGYSLWRARRSG